MIGNCNPISTVPDEGVPVSPAFREVIAYLKGVTDAVALQANHQGPLSVRPLSEPPFWSRPSALLASTRSPAIALAPSSWRPGMSLFPYTADSDASDLRSAPAIGHESLEDSITQRTGPVSSGLDFTRGGARTIDLGSVHPLRDSAPVAVWRPTIPFGAPTLSFPALSSVGSSWEPTRGGTRTLDLRSVLPLPNSEPAAIWRRTIPYGAPTVSVPSLLSVNLSTPWPQWADNDPVSDVRLRTAELSHEWYELTKQSA